MVCQELYQGRDFDRSGLQSARQAAIMDDLPVPDVNAVVRDEPSRRHQMITDAQTRPGLSTDGLSGNDPSSNIFFHRCVRVSVRISVSSGRGFADAQASPPSGAMITLRPPRRCMTPVSSRLTFCVEV